jgi:putative FmdB family regulatory protein
VPTYQYACTATACGHRFEAVQSFSDDPLTICPQCESRVRKVFSAVGVVFKGSGFYRTDSRAAANGGSAANGKAGSNGKANSNGTASSSESSSSESSSSRSSSSSSSSGSTGSAPSTSTSSSRAAAS